MTTQSVYASIAPWYDQLAGFDDPQAVCQHLDQMLHQLGVKPGGTLLDLGAGTGANALPLASLGWHLHCLECNPDMMQQGQQKTDSAPAAYQGRIQWQLADITDYTAPAPADGAVCLCNTVNHLPTLQAVAQMATCTANALKPGGIWLLDADEWQTFETFFDHPRYKTLDDGHRTCVYQQGSFDPTLGVAIFDVDIWQYGPSLMRQHQAMTLHYHSPDDIRPLFTQAGFTVLAEQPYNPFPVRYAGVDFSPKRLWVLRLG
jgi:SAM-dependent methyltransferase